MAFPNILDNLSTGMSGTIQLSDATLDHANQHRQIGTAVNAIENFLGTNSANNGVFSGYQAGWFPLALNGGTPQIALQHGTFNNGVFGTPSVTGGTYTAPTFSGQGTNTGTLGGGMYGTATHQGGTAIGMTIDTTSILQPLKSAFYAVVGSNTQAFGTNQTTQVVLNTLKYDLLGEFGTITSNFVAQNAGLYQFTGFIDVGNLTSGCDPQVFLNGTLQQGGALFLTQGGWVHWQGSVPVGGTVNFKLLNVDTTHIGTIQVYGGGTTYFSGHRIF